MAEQYFVADDRRRGALSWEKVWDLARTGEIGADTLILLPGASRWERACEIEHIRDFFPVVSSTETAAMVFPEQPKTSFEHAGAYPRLLARAIDMLILMLVLTASPLREIITMVTLETLGMPPEIARNVGGRILQTPILVDFLIFGLISAICMILAGTTPGKAILGIRVRRLTGGSAVWVYLVRELRIWVFVFCLGFMPAAVFQIGRQRTLLRFGQPAIHDGNLTIVEGRPSGGRILFGAFISLVLMSLVLATDLWMEGLLFADPELPHPG